MMMTKAPEIRFLVAAPGLLAPPDKQLLAARIPLSRPVAVAQDDVGPTYRDYLQGIRELLLEHTDELIAAVTQEAGNDGTVGLLDIIVEKHGSDYHPARVRAHLPDSQVSLVANVALTDRGATRLASDFRWLNIFRNRFTRSFVPRAYFFVERSADAASRENPVLNLFVGQWLEGYHEFHLSSQGDGDETAIEVWDTSAGHFTLAQDIACELFKQAAFALTYYYDVATFREVFPWHHASGDFVVKASENVIDVKLVTVRQYASRVVFTDDLPEHHITACLAFFANLTVRMRLDRLDGTGDVAWADEACVQGTVQGFFDGLREQVREGRCERDFIRLLFNTLQDMSLADWAELFRDVVESYDANAPDMPVVRENLVEHILTVTSVVGEARLNGFKDH
jgi:hypothetical protein